MKQPELPPKKTVPMSMRRHSRGSSTATRHHVVHTSSGPCMISWGPSLRKTVNRMSGCSAAQSLASLGADEGEGGSALPRRRRRRRREDSIAAVCGIFGRRKRWCAMWRTFFCCRLQFLLALDLHALMHRPVQKTKGPVVEFIRPTSGILLHIKNCGAFLSMCHYKRLK